jgi:hypothetical protein
MMVKFTIVVFQETTDFLLLLLNFGFKMGNFGLQESLLRNRNCFVLEFLLCLSELSYQTILAEMKSMKKQFL